MKSFLIRHDSCEILSIKHSCAIIFILLSGVLVRIALSFLYDFESTFYGGDSQYYLNVGESIADNGVHGIGGEPTYYRPPLYSFFVALLLNFSENIYFFYMVQSAIYLIFSIIVYRLLLRIDYRIAVFSSLLIAIMPFDALYNGRVLAENIITPLIVLSTLIFMLFHYSKLKIFFSGVLVGCVILTHDVYLLLPLYFFFFGLIIKAKRVNLIVYLLGVALIITPWLYRNNELTGGGFSLSEGRLWTNIWIGTWERDPRWTFNGGHLPEEALKTFNDGKYPGKVLEAWKQRDQSFFKEVTLNYVSSEPISVIKSWLVRYPYLWFGTRTELFNTYAARDENLWYLIKVISFFLSSFIIVTGFLGIVSSLKFNLATQTLLVPILYIASIYIPLHNTETRYSEPIVPILCIFAALFILKIFDKWSKKINHTAIKSNANDLTSK